MNESLIKTAPEFTPETLAVSSEDISSEAFAELLETYLTEHDLSEGRVVKGHITNIDNDFVIVDVGLKTEGRIPKKEFLNNGVLENIEINSDIEVYVERIENALGDIVLSREKARREETWKTLEKKSNASEPVNGVIFMRTRGGFYVNLDGVKAFLPGSQVDIRPIRDISPLMNKEQPFQILKIDRKRNNIVVSRRAILEESRAEQKAELINKIKEGDVCEGFVKCIVEYGAFIDIGGMDGLMHLTDMSWRRITHPSQTLSQGDTVKVQVIKTNHETQRISLGMKQLTEDPWTSIEEKYQIGSKCKGRITNITDYGAFVEIEDGVEGLIHSSEMSWTKKNIHPSKLLSISQEVEVVVLSIDRAKRRISLGLKQVSENPWISFSEKNPQGSIVEGNIKSITEFGLFIGLSDDIDGMVHYTDISWNNKGEELIKNYKKGELVKAKVLSIDMEKERISLGIKQLKEDPMKSVDFHKGDTVTCTITEIATNGIEVSLGKDNANKAFIKKSDLSRDRLEQRTERFAVGDKVDAMITSIDKNNRKIILSIKALEVAEEKEAVAQYGSSDSGASLRDILGAALLQEEEEADDTKAEQKTTSHKSAKTKDSSKTEKKETDLGKKKN